LHTDVENIVPEARKLVSSHDVFRLRGGT